MQNTEINLNEVTRTESEKIIKKHVLIAMGVGAIPIPYVDMLALATTHVSMISKLAKYHNVPFSNERIRSVLVALLGGIGSQSLATGTFGSIIKSVPLVGSIIGMVTYPAVAGTVTYGVGQVFDKHFAEGGNLFDFNPAAKKAQLREEMDKGAEEIKKS